MVCVVSFADYAGIRRFRLSAKMCTFAHSKNNLSIDLLSCDDSKGKFVVVILY